MYLIIISRVADQMGVSLLEVECVILNLGVELIAESVIVNSITSYKTLFISISYTNFIQSTIHTT